MKTIKVRCGHQLHEIAVASFVFGQQREVIRRFPPRWRPVLVRYRRHVNLAADDRFHPSTLRFLVNRLREEFHVYMVESSRINIAGINHGNVDRVADSIAS